ncbi:hypothetical protein H4R22_002703 [Coemansia sp. RSA 1290]|nr:hypothetical protein H4R22_002703 [Coemansia sp. RSA 1290]
MIPASAVQAGKYGNDPVFIGRAPHKGSMQVGMVTMSKEGLVITYDGKPLLFREYEVLCGPSGKYRWMPVHGRFDPKDIKGSYPRPQSPPYAKACGCSHDQHPRALYSQNASSQASAPSMYPRNIPSRQGSVSSRHSAHSQLSAVSSTMVNGHTYPKHSQMRQQPYVQPKQPAGPLYSWENVRYGH